MWLTHMLLLWIETNRHVPIILILLLSYWNQFSHFPFGIKTHDSHCISVFPQLYSYYASLWHRTPATVILTFNPVNCNQETLWTNSTVQNVQNLPDSVLSPISVCISVHKLIHILYPKSNPFLQFILILKYSELDK